MYVCIPDCVVWFARPVGHCLLERYGMTEVGMALSNSYRGERKAVSICGCA